MTAMFRIIREGLYREVGLPEPRKQHLGIAPGGAMDQFSYTIGNRLLDNPISAKALEMIIPPVIQFERDCHIALTGAPFEKVTLKNSRSGNQILMKHGSSVPAEEGAILQFHNRLRGFRTYLCYREGGPEDKGSFQAERRGLAELYRWQDKDYKIRVIEGPEYPFLQDSAAFFSSYWTISNEFSDMGFKLTRKEGAPVVDMENMISGAVADGTIQAPPGGLIVLLRHRQTIGGYPRILNVISADVDLLAQYAPNQIIRFRKISLAEAHETARLKREIQDDPVVAIG